MGTTTVHPEVTMYFDAEGRQHRTDGPARFLTYGGGKTEWYWHGQVLDSAIFSDFWEPEQKAWWVMAKMSGAK